jgi:hypothetical protein
MDKRLLKPGWAGLLGLNEAAYIQSALEKNGTLRRLWGFNKNVHLSGIARRAYPEDPRGAVKYLDEQTPEAKQPPKRAAKRKESRNGHKRGVVVPRRGRPKPSPAAVRSREAKKKLTAKVGKPPKDKVKAVRIQQRALPKRRIKAASIKKRK